jgi:hypothetical protein
MPLQPDPNLCLKCHANLALVGIRHRCITNVTNKPITNPILITNAGASPSIEVQRVKDWRKMNPDRYREYMKAYMAKRRRVNAGLA